MSSARDQSQLFWSGRRGIEPPRHERRCKVRALRVLRWNSQTGELIAFERKCDVVELPAQVAGRDIHDPTRMEEDLRLRVPAHRYHREVHTRHRDEQSAGETK